MAEGRGKAQADTLRKARSETMANRLLPNGQTEQVPSSKLRADDVVLVSAGEFIPSDGEIIEGVASVDESAITGESAPVIREAGGDRSAVTGGTRVLSDQIKVQITSQPRRNLPRPHDRPGGRRRAAEDAERDRAEHSARRTDDHLPAGGGHVAAVRHLLRLAADGLCAGLAAGLPDSDHHRRPALRHRHRGHGPADPAQRAGHVRPRRGSRGRREHAAARQDRHHHARQPPGVALHSRARRHRGGAGRRGPAFLAGRRNPRRPLHRGAGEGKVRLARTRILVARSSSSFPSPRRRACRA